MYKARNKDIPRIMDFVSSEPEMNLFTIGDIEAFGLESDKCQVFLYEEKERIKSTILLYHSYMTLYFNEFGFDLTPVAEKINQLIKNGATVLSGKKEVIDAIQGHLNGKIKSVSRDYFAKCEHLNKLDMVSYDKVQYAGVDHAQEIVELFDSIPEFKGNTPVDVMKQALLDGSRKTTIVKIKNKICSTASLTAETKNSGMIIGVATHPKGDHRRKGFASACVSKLVDDLKKSGKTACLFYDNPEAGSIYKKIGFRDIGFWVMVRFE